jgi:hypothetical protein
MVNKSSVIDIFPHRKIEPEESYELWGSLGPRIGPMVVEISLWTQIDNGMLLYYVHGYN